VPQPIKLSKAKIYGDAITVLIAAQQTMENVFCLVTVVEVALEAEGDGS
jgi:hypothetical protein